ncbi:MAG: Hsp70 family protein [Oligoflexia bacterium]|nr:Hsp70 family protein [Oligoflexia bacterium]
MILGIDLGTTNASAAVIKKGRPVFVKTGYSQNCNILPSVVGYNDKGEIVAGEEARDLCLVNPDSAIRSVKNYMGKNKDIVLRNPLTSENVSYKPYEISSKILERIKKLASEQLGERITRAVITVPAYFNDKARKDTIKAGAMAGLEVVRIINEPTAAALCYGLHNKGLENNHVMVYDLGGGTFDISVIEINDDIIEVIASDGDRSLGGDRFDYALFSSFYKKIKAGGNADIDNLVAMSILLNESEQAKIHLSSVVKKSLSIKEFGFDEVLYREDFENLIKPFIDKTVDQCRAVVEKSGIGNRNIDKILLVGGSTRIPYVRNVLESALKVPVSQEIDPDLAVVTGAAIQAAIIEGRQVDSVLVDVAPHSLSVSCVIEKNGRTVPNFCSKLIRKNTPIPCTVEETFSTLNDNQDTVRIAVYQGESDFEENNVLIKELKFSGLKGRKAGETEILVNFSYKLDGTVDITACEDGTKNKLMDSCATN